MKSLVRVHFGTSVPREGAPIAYLRSNPITMNSAVSIVDTSNVLPLNSFFEKDIEIKLDGDDLTYYIDKDGFLLTDWFNNDNEPLYYKHTINHNIYSPTGSTSDIIVVDVDGIQVDTRFWIYDCSSESIYHSLEQNNDSIYFVQYPRADADGNLINGQHQEMLESAPAFVAANETHIDSNGYLWADADAYILEEQDGQPYLWRLTLPRSGTFRLRYTDEGLLKLKSSDTPQSDPWYVEIQQATLLLSKLSTNDFLKYTIAEFNTQNFYPFVPIKFIADHKATILQRNIISVNRSNLVVSNKTPIDIKVYNAQGNLIRALTTDENKIGAKSFGISWEVDTIQNIDTSSGKILIQKQIEAGEYVLVSFYHKENKYKYTGINLNPVYNQDIVNQKVAVLVRPSATGCNSTLSHVVMSQDEVIVSASDENISTWLGSSNKTLDDLKNDWLYIPGESTDNTNNYLMLGLINVSYKVNPDEIDILDIRRRGGGIIDTLIEQAIKQMPGSYQNWDIKHWDGPPAPIQNTSIVYLPSWILNVFTEDEIRARASKYSAAGCYLIFKYYD